MELPADTGGTTRKYIEVKTVSGSKWYSGRGGERAVERRVLSINNEYRRAAAAADLRYYQVEEGPIGQRLSQLDLVGVSFGRFGEASESVHQMIKIMAEARVKQQELAWCRGEAEEKPHLSVETGYIRRRISSAAVSAFGHRLVSRMSQVGIGGQGAKQAAQRRRVWEQEEAQARLDRGAAWVARVTGRDIVRRGRFWTG